MLIGRLKWAWDRTASSLLAQLESCDLIKIWLRYQHLSSQDGCFCAFWALFFQTQLHSDAQINQAVSLQQLKQSGTYYISPEGYRRGECNGAHFNVL